MTNSRAEPKITRAESEFQEKQAVAATVLGAPFVAAALPAAAAAAIGIYGTYQEDIRQLYNSLFGKITLRQEIRKLSKYCKKKYIGRNNKNEK